MDTAHRTPARRAARPSRSALHPFSLWHAFTRLRRTRPFWGCLILAAGGWFVLSPVLGNISVTLETGVGGMAAYVLGLGMLLAAGFAFIVPAQRHFPALIAALFSVASLPLANLGGWLISMILGIVGSGLVFAWTPYTDAQLERIAQREQVRADRRAARRGATHPQPEEEVVIDAMD